MPQTEPLDPDSPRGRELARELTIVLDDIAEAIAERRRLAAVLTEQVEQPGRAA